MSTYQEIINFWFNEADKSNWFAKSNEFDQLLISKYSKLHSQASKCELFKWRETSEGRLAEIIILDQFSRNIFRDSPLSFAQDAVDLALAQEAIAQNIEKFGRYPHRNKILGRKSTSQEVEFLKSSNSSF